MYDEDDKASHTGKVGAALHRKVVEGRSRTDRWQYCIEAEGNTTRWSIISPLFENFYFLKTTSRNFIRRADMEGSKENPLDY